VVYCNIVYLAIVGLNCPEVLELYVFLVDANLKGLQVALLITDEQSLEDCLVVYGSNCIGWKLERSVELWFL
jgi:hypothetical protein